MTRVDAIRQRVAASTPEPWHIMTDEYGRPVAVWNPELRGVEDSIIVFERRSEDMVFIAHARQDIPVLLEAFETLRDLFEQLIDKGREGVDLTKTIQMLAKLDTE